ncbi:HAD hydrolase-like protein [Candidatus Shapirobacteria bacterium]|nr:HAD hydrolase-like protein [Candidatus Shapirobacteria bacterium]
MKTFIFDFDGTIVDNLNQVMDLLQKNLASRSIDLSKYPVSTLRNTGVREFMKRIKISKLELLSIYKDIKKEIHLHLLDSAPVPDLASTLKQLTHSCQLYIFSSNNRQTILSYLQKYNLNQYFTDIFEDDSYFGKDAGLKKIVKSKKLDPQNTFYFGDESRDILASKKAGLKSVGVLWGFEGEVPLSAANPDYLINKPKELLNLI